MELNVAGFNAVRDTLDEPKKRSRRPKCFKIYRGSSCVASDVIARNHKDALLSFIGVKLGRIVADATVALSVHENDIWDFAVKGSSKVLYYYVGGPIRNYL